MSVYDKTRHLINRAMSMNTPPYAAQKPTEATPEAEAAATPEATPEAEATPKPKRAPNPKLSVKLDVKGMSDAALDADIAKLEKYIAARKAVIEQKAQRLANAATKAARDEAKAADREREHRAILMGTHLEYLAKQPNADQNVIAVCRLVANHADAKIATEKANKLKKAGK